MKTKASAFRFGKLFLAMVLPSLALGASETAPIAKILDHDVVALYRFEGTASTMGNDLSVNANHLNAWGRPPQAYADAERGTVAGFVQVEKDGEQDEEKTQQLFGSGSNYEIANAPTGSDSFTISLWLKVENWEGKSAKTKNNEVVFAFGKNGNGQCAFLRLNRDGSGGGTLMYTNYGNNKFFGDASTLSGWHHLCFVNGDNTRTIYLDGARVDEAASTRNIQASPAFQIGYGGGKFSNWSKAWGLLNGCIDDFVFLKGALTAAEVVQLKDNLNELIAPPDTSLVLFGETSLTRNAAGGLADVSTVVTQGVGKVEAQVVRLVDAATNTVVLAASVDASSEAKTVSGSLGTFDANTMYTYALVGTTEEGKATVQEGGVNLYSGTLTVSAGKNAEERTLSPGTFVVSRADTDAAKAGDLTVFYTVSGGEGTYKPLTGQAVIPSGASSVTISVEPVFCEAVAEDVEVALTLTEGPYVYLASEAPSAVLQIVNTETFSSDIYLSTTGADTNDGLSQDTPKKTLKAALDLAAQFADYGARVFVAKGEYVHDLNYLNYKGLPLEGPIQLIGMTGRPEDVVLKKTGWPGRAFYVNHAEASISSVTIEGGYLTGQAKGSGVWIDANGGMVSNCIVRSCITKNYQGSAAVYASGTSSVVTHTVVADSQIDDENRWGGYKAAGIHLVSGARAENCLVTNCCQTAAKPAEEGYPRSAGGILAETDCLVRNCTVIGCKGTITGGIYPSAESAKVVNCAVFGCGYSYTSEETKDAAAKEKAWAGLADCFDHCATDGEAAINSTCLAGLTASDFVNVAGLNFRPVPGGLLNNTGTSYAGLAAIDLDGRKRFAGKAVDIGCYEGKNLGFVLSIR